MARDDGLAIPAAKAIANLPISLFRREFTGKIVKLKLIVAAFHGKFRGIKIANHGFKLPIPGKI
jgi:hypothetical protein